MYTHHHNILATRAILVISGVHSLTAQPLSLDLMVLSLPVPPVDLTTIYPSKTRTAMS